MDTLEERISSIERITKETNISLSLNLDGSGEVDIDSDVPFLDHMLTLFGVHGFFNLTVKAEGDIEIDDHHTVEDIGICLGQAFGQALKDKGGIQRYGHCYLPMDETLVRVALDISNRPYLHYNVPVSEQVLGTFSTALALEFMRAFAQHAGITLHIDLLHGDNTHHILEAVFKGLGRALHQSTRSLEGSQGVLSSKGCL